jgi:hypothetical protein
MTTLAAVNDTLLEVSNNTKETSKGISAFVKYIEKQKVKDFETEREAKANQAKLNKAEDQANRSNKSNKSKSDGGLFGGLGNLGKVGLIGSALALGPKIGSAIVRRIPALAVIAFADEIAETLLGPNFEKETKESISRGLTGGGLGALLGKRFILPFAALGVLATDENKKMLKDIGKNLKTNWDESAKALAPFLGFLPSFDNILKFIGTGTTSGLKAIKGFTESGFNSEEFKSNWVAGAGLLGTAAALLMPGKFAKGLKFLAKFAGSKKGLVLAALAGGTFVYDKFFNEDGSAIESGAAVLGTSALAYGGYKLLKGSGGRPNSSFQNNNAGQQAQNSYNQNLKNAAKASKSDLNKNNMTKTKNGGVSMKDGKIPSNKQLSQLKVNKPSMSSQYPRLFGSKGLLSNMKGYGPLALLGGYFATQEVQDILASNDSEADKKAKISKILGETVNASALGIIGAGISGMAFGPAGAVLGGIGGSMLALMAPNVAGDYLADFFMGKGPMAESQQNKIKSLSHIKKGGVGSLGTGMNTPFEISDISSTVGIIPQDLKFKKNDYNQRLKNNMYNMSGIGDAGITSISTGNKVNSDNNSSTTSTSVSNTSVSSRGGILDLQDQFGFGLSQT